MFNSQLLLIKKNIFIIFATQLANTKCNLKKEVGARGDYLSK